MTEGFPAKTGIKNTRRIVDDGVSAPGRVIGGIAGRRVRWTRPAQPAPEQEHHASDTKRATLGNLAHFMPNAS